MLKIRKQKHQCPLCLKFFRHRINLSSHVCTVESLVCIECNATFSKESVLQKHTIKYHSTQSHQKRTTLHDKRKDFVVHEEVSNLRASSVIGQTSADQHDSILNRLPPQRNTRGKIRCQKCSKFIVDLHSHALSHITVRRFKCGMARCDYCSWSRQKIQSHMKTNNHMHAAIIDNDSPELHLQITQIKTQCFGQSQKGREFYVKAKRAQVRCNKCSALVSDRAISRIQHAKVHITVGGRFGCSEPGCGYNTWWKNKMHRHIQQHTDATMIEHESSDLQQRVADTEIECFGALSSLRAHAGTEQIPMETNVSNARASPAIGIDPASDEPISNCLPRATHPGRKQCRKCFKFVRYRDNPNLQQHAQSHMEGVRRFSCSLAGCDYSSWYRQKMQVHIERSENHTHATTIDNNSPKLKLQVAKMMSQCFGESKRRRRNAKAKPGKSQFALVRCNKCSASVSDVSAYRKQHAKVHIMDVDVEQFGCSEPGCGYNTWWRHSITKHIQQHPNANIIDHQGPDLQQRVADMAIECFGSRDQHRLTPSKPTVPAPAGRSDVSRVEGIVGKKRKTKKKSHHTGHSFPSKSLVSQCAAAVASDSNTQPINNNEQQQQPISIESSFVTNPGALLEEQTAHETCERIHRKMDALQQRLKRLKNMVGKK